MKKSEMYKAAQLAVLKSEEISAEDKLEILNELLSDESTAIFTEKRKAEESQ
jgi:hypothetical protein